MQVCPSCGEENPDRFRVCGFCGTKLAPDVPADQFRKTVSVIFTDLKGSTQLGERLDPEVLRNILSIYFQEMQGVIARHGGRVEKYIGDAIVAVFGLPRAHEDDALRAVRAAEEMRQSLAQMNERIEEQWGVRLENRTGVNTGEVVAGDVHAGQHLVTGDTMNTAARLEQAAPTNEVLIGANTFLLVRDAVEVEPVEPLDLKGKSEPVPAYRLVSVPAQEAMPQRPDAPMVGRERELEALLGALDRAIAGRSAQLVTVLAPAGVGKSRLLRHLIDATEGRAWSFRGRCLSYGEGITFWPLGEIVRQAAGISDESGLDARRMIAEVVGDDRADVEERLAAAIGLSEESFPIQETFWAVRSYLETIAREQPVIALIEDIHWAEQALLDLIRFVHETSGDAPLLLVCSSRPELLEEHPDWAEPRENAVTVELPPLSEADTFRIVENLLGQADIDEAVRARIIEAAAGNPLFVEQMVSMLQDEGTLARDEHGRWVVTGDPGTISVPPSINALLTARLDRLGQSERSVVERAAVTGMVFFRGAIRELVPEGLRDQVDTCLTKLVEKEFIAPTESFIVGQDAFKFLHILIRETAYHGALKKTRADIHEQFVNWVERVDTDRGLEFGEIRGYHLEDAYLTLVQLGSIDAHVREVGKRGARYLSSAGRRALARSDMHAAANLLSRAGALLAEDEQSRIDLQLEAGEAQIEVGEFLLADASLENAREGAVNLHLPELEATALLVRRQMRFMTEGEGSDDELIGSATRAIPLLEQRGYHPGLARAWRLMWIVHATAGRNSEAERAALRTMEEARLAGDQVLETRFSTSLAFAALYGPTPVRDAIQRCREVLARVAEDRKAEALTLSVLARLEAMQGDFESAREKYRRSRTVLAELGWKLHAALTSLVSGQIEMAAGDLAAAEAELDGDYRQLQAMGEKNYIATTAACLAEVQYRQGRYEDAEETCTFSREVAAEDDVASQALWRCVQGKVQARRDEFDVAERLLREAVEIISRTDDLNQQGDSFLDLAEVLMLAGRSDESEDARKQATALYEQKGNIVSAERARSSTWTR
jgi:class 3 adenylate cyclase/tetratricopeptide (TPR) repeat protein